MQHLLHNLHWPLQKVIYKSPHKFSETCSPKCNTQVLVASVLRLPRESVAWNWMPSSRCLSSGDCLRKTNNVGTKSFRGLAVIFPPLSSFRWGFFCWGTRALLLHLEIVEMICILICVNIFHRQRTGRSRLGHCDLPCPRKSTNLPGFQVDMVCIVFNWQLTHMDTEAAPYNLHNLEYLF